MIHRLGRIDVEGIQLLRALSDSESARADEAIGALRSYFQRPAFPLTVEMCDELKAAIDRVAPGSPIPLARIGDPSEVTFWVASRLVLWLEAIRIFLETTETRLIRAYGKNSNFWASWEHWKGDLFDTYPSYRLLYHLRNKTHEALPPIWFHSRSARLPSGEPGAFNEIGLDPGQLLAAFEEWRSEVRQDLESADSVMPLMPLIIEHQGNIELLATHLMHMERTEVVDEANLLRELAKEAAEGDPSSDPVILHFAAEEDIADISQARVSVIDVQHLEWFHSVLQGKMVIQQTKPLDQ